MLNSEPSAKGLVARVVTALFIILIVFALFLLGMFYDLISSSDVPTTPV